MCRNALCLIALAGLLSSPLQAGDILRPGAKTGTAIAQGPSSVTPPVAASVANARANDILSRSSSALAAVAAMQAAAHSAALQGANNLGADPNHLGQQLPDV